MYSKFGCLKSLMAFVYCTNDMRDGILQLMVDYKRPVCTKIVVLLPEPLHGSN